MKTKTQAQIQVEAFINACLDNGFSWEIASPSILRIKKHFTPNDKNAYCECDMMGESVLSYAPLKGGSIWGTDGGSVGGHIGLTNGYYELNKSGEGKRFMLALANF
jgi:hypothetical protein